MTILDVRDFYRRRDAFEAKGDEAVCTGCDKPFEPGDPFSIPAKPRRHRLGERRHSCAVPLRVVALFERPRDRGQHAGMDSSRSAGVLPISRCR